MAKTAGARMRIKAYPQEFLLTATLQKGVVLIHPDANVMKAPLLRRFSPRKR